MKPNFHRLAATVICKEIFRGITFGRAGNYYSVFESPSLLCNNILPNNDFNTVVDRVSDFGESLWSFAVLSNEKLALPSESIHLDRRTY